MLERKLKFIKKLEELTKENKLQWSFRATMYSFYEVCHTRLDNQNSGAYDVAEHLASMVVGEPLDDGDKDNEH